MVTVAAKRTERLHTDLISRVSRRTNVVKRDFDLIVYGVTGYTGRLVAEYLATILSRRRCSVLGDRGTLDPQAPEGACRDRRTGRSAFGEGGCCRAGQPAFDVRACGRDHHGGR